MTEYSKNISFWGLLTSKKIVIPIIQRDYAQGRIGKEYLRERFLGQLFAALQGDAKPLVLDFVYGSVEADTLYVSVSAILSCRPFFILIFLLCIKMKHYGFSRKSIWKNLETFP